MKSNYRNLLSRSPKAIFVLAILFGFLASIQMSASPAQAQDLFLKDKIGDFGNIPSDDPVEMSSTFKIVKGKTKGILRVTAEIQPNWHVFSMNKTKGPMPSKFTVEESDKYKVIGKFRPDRKPHIVEEKGFDEPCEEFEGEITWSAPIQLADGVDPEDLTINVVYNGQTCETGGSCLPLTFELEGEFDGYDESLTVKADFVQPDVKIEDFAQDGLHTKVRARLIRASGIDKPIRPGDVVKLEITATPTDNYHVYSYSLEKTDYMSTIVGFTETNNWIVKGPVASEEPEEGEAFGKPAFYHHDPITWSFYVSIPSTAKSDDSYTVSGAIGYHACSDSTCDQPAGASFEASIPLGKAAIVPVKWKEASYAVAKKADKAQPMGADGEIPKDEGQKVDDADEDKESSYPVLADTPEKLAEMLGYYNSDEKINYVTLSGNTTKTTFWTALFGAFVGGMLLNLMPCVFPVLGLKVMGFVMQAGSEPKKIRNHGIAFTAGLVVSMWVLAGFILVLKLSFNQSVNWGQQMGNPYFVCGIIVLLFLLGLNMAGVFEIGTSLTSVGGSASQKKGYSGSFFSGILTTLIATPCSGPFLGAAMGYTLAQPAEIAMVLFTVFALGIALPYLVLSFFPSLIYKLPKPGPWMETFKAIMAFTLFATVAFFARTFGAQTGIKGLSWLLMALVVVGLAAYVYGQWSPSEVKSTKKRFLVGYGLAGLLALLGGYMCFDAAQQKGEVVSHGDWDLWAPGKVEYSLAKRQPIIWVDYTADW